jgi:hypothetical protein
MTTISRSRSISILATMAVAALALSACATETPAPAPSSSASVEPSASPSAEPAGNPPPLTDLVLTTEGLGADGTDGLVFGAAPPTGDPASDLVIFDPDACADTELPDPGLWLANYPQADEGFGLVAPFAIALKDARLARIDIRSSTIITDEGLALGSSLDAVLGTYPGGPDEVVNHADVTDVYVFMGEKGKLMFEVAVDRIPGYWEADDLDTVVFLSAVSIDTPAYGVAATDNGIGFCNIA